MVEEAATLANVEPIADTEPRRLFAQGAESRLWEAQLAGRPAIVKQRFSKQYRHPTLDRKLTAARLKQEVRGMVRARKMGALTPVLYAVDLLDATISMEKVAGSTVKALLHSGSLAGKDLERVLRQIGEAVAVLHDGGMVHGDLTTSNLMVRSRDNALVVLDFGLSTTSAIPEDKGVDLYVLERAFKSAHSADGDGLFEVVLAAYKKKSRQWNSTLNKFSEVRMRGRKRAMIG